MADDNMNIYTFYRFKNLEKIKSLKLKLDKFLKDKLILGTILLANEGINGTVSGSQKDLDDMVYQIKKFLNIRKLSIKVSKNQFIPFYRLKVRLKKEIVTIGDMSVKPDKVSGKYIHPIKWDNIINNKKYLIIDTRNNYEVQIGSFKNSKNPKTKSFRGFPNFIKKLDIKKDQPIAMYCTGGIRCEKASSYLITKGFKDVSQLDGGILNYLEFNKKNKKNTWDGECFVFDNRVSVDKNLKKGSFDQCYGCRHPITDKDKSLNSYKKGAYCRYCKKNKSVEKIQGSLTRQEQIEDAEQRKIKHSFKKIYSRSSQ